MKIMRLLDWIYANPDQVERVEENNFTDEELSITVPCWICEDTDEDEQDYCDCCQGTGVVDVGDVDDLLDKMRILYSDQRRKDQRLLKKYLLETEDR